MMDNISLRQATLADSNNILAWRNHKAVRENCVQSHIIEPSVHEAWLKKIIASEDAVLLIAEYEAQPIGTLRFDFKPPEAEISLYLIPELIGKGWGKFLLAAGEKWLKNERRDITRIIAQIMPHNSRSLQLFSQLGYEKKIEIYKKEINNAPV